MMAQRFYLVLFLFGLSYKTVAQSCCASGSGSPIAGGTSQGVLADRQAEVGFSFQYVNTNKFFTGDKEANNFLDNYNSKYLYGRFAYGVTKAFTISLEAGYYLNRTQIGLYKSDTVSSFGLGDLIIFPRYEVYHRNTEKTKTEITVGLGYKIPLGKYLDSSVVYTDPAGKDYYTPKPPAVMTTTGSHDIIFYAFLFRQYQPKEIKFFANILYIKKGWNGLGERFGDYASVGLFAGKTFFRKLGVTLQLKGEWIAEMQYDHSKNMLALYNLDVRSTGGKKVFFVPQLSYSFNKFSVYALDEIPVYQYVNGTAIGSQLQFTLGISYRFYMVKQND